MAEILLKTGLSVDMSKRVVMRLGTILGLYHQGHSSLLVESCEYGVCKQTIQLINEAREQL